VSQRVDTVDPVIETASEDGRVLATDPALVALGAASAPNTEAERGTPPFAARFQGILIVVMLLGMVMIGQQANKTLYQIGLPVLVVAAFLQIAFGNIPPRSDFRRSMGMLVLTWVIVAALFVLSIQLAPTLIGLGRQG